MIELLGPSPDVVKGWLADVDGRILEIQNEIEPLLVEQGTLRERRKLLAELLTSLGEEAPPSVSGNDSHLVLHHPTTEPTAARKETTRDRVHREVVTVLREVGRPLHINDLLEEYVKRGYKVPGQGKAANISVHISGWDDIENPERGVYGLVDSVADQEGDR